MLDDMLAPVNSVCLLALSRFDRHALALLLCAGLIVLFCAVLACNRCSTTTCSYIQRKGPQEQRKWKKKALLKPILAQLDLQSIEKVPYSTLGQFLCSRIGGSKRAISD